MFRLPSRARPTPHLYVDAVENINEVEKRAKTLAKSTAQHDDRGIYPLCENNKRKQIMT